MFCDSPLRSDCFFSHSACSTANLNVALFMGTISDLYLPCACIFVLQIYDFQNANASKKCQLIASSVKYFSPCEKHALRYDYRECRSNA